MRFDKLVRDKIIEKWDSDYGKNPKTHIAGDEEFYEKLKEKLVEEAKEFVREDDEKELADILEVIYAIFEFKNLAKSQLEEMRLKKEEKSGAFKKRIILEDSED